MNPSEEEIISYSKKRIIELLGVEEKWAEKLAHKLWGIILSTGGGVADLKSLDEDVRVIVKSWVEDGFLRDED